MTIPRGEPTDKRLHAIPLHEGDKLHMIPYWLQLRKQKSNGWGVRGRLGLRLQLWGIGRMK